MAKTKDDLEAVRDVVTALEGFEPEAQERIIRWAREKLGLASAPRSVSDSRETYTPPARPPDAPVSQQQAASPTPSAPSKDLKTFVATKSPKSDVQFAAVVAYYYRFEAPPAQRKDEIDAATLQDACRLADRTRFPKPDQTLRNAKNQGLLDSGGEAGKFHVNTVGENLVAMALPGQSNNKPAKVRRARKPTRKTKPAAKR